MKQPSPLDLEGLVPQSRSSAFAVEQVLECLFRQGWRSTLAIRGAWSFAVWTGGMPRSTQGLDLAYLNRNSEPAAVARGLQVLLETGMSGLHVVSMKTDGIAWTRQTTVRLLVDGERSPMPITLHVAHHVGSRRHVECRRMALPHDRQSPRAVICLTPEWMIAEKAALLVTYGAQHSRLQDILDLWTLCRNRRFDGRMLADAFVAVFRCRDAERMLLRQDGYWEAAFNPALRPRLQHDQWERLARTSSGDRPLPGLRRALLDVGDFLLPPLRALRSDRPHQAHWHPDRAWTLPSCQESESGLQPVLPLTRAGWTAGGHAAHRVATTLY